MTRKKILFVHHSGVFGGSSRSLGELVYAMPKDEICPIIISQNGTANNYFAKKGFIVFPVYGLAKFDITELGHYRGIRWLILLRELIYIWPTFSALRAVKKAYPDIDLAHINDIQNFISALLIKNIFQIPIVIHIRGPLMKRRGWRYKFLMWFLRKYVDQVIAIDENVKRTVSETIITTVVHNGFIIPTNSSHIIKPTELTIGMVSNMFRFKGVLDFVEAARICKKNKLPVKFVILGGKNETKDYLIDKVLEFLGLKHNVEKEVHDRIASYELQNTFDILPFTENIHTFYNEISALCFPSHINAVGRPVFEAGFYHVPSIVAISDPLPDAIVHMGTGICIQEKNPESLYSAIHHFYNNPLDILRMGENAFKLAKKNYDVYSNAKKIFDIYVNLMKPKVT